MQYLWIIALFITSVLAAYLSHKSNHSTEWKWSVYLWSLNLIPLWAIIARFSKNILFDGILYDILLTVIYTLTMTWLMSRTVNFSVTQIVCLVVMVVALMVFKFGG